MKWVLPVPMDRKYWGLFNNNGQLQVGTQRKVGRHYRDWASDEPQLEGLSTGPRLAQGQVAPTLCGCRLGGRRSALL